MNFILSKASTEIYPSVPGFIVSNVADLNVGVRTQCGLDNQLLTLHNLPRPCTSFNSQGYLLVVRWIWPKRAKNRNIVAGAVLY